MMNDLNKKLHHLATLQDNWDGQGGEAPNEKSLTLASKVLDKSDELGLEYSVLPCPDNGVSILYGNQHTIAAIECGNNGEIAIAFAEGPGTTVAFDVLENDIEINVMKIKKFLFDK